MKTSLDEHNQTMFPEHREVKPEDFVGKTIARFDGECCNIWRLWFTDGTAFAVHIECNSGLPEPLICEDCIAP